MDKNYMLMSDKLFHPVSRRELILSSCNKKMPVTDLS